MNYGAGAGTGCIPPLWCSTVWLIGANALCLLVQGPGAEIEISEGMFDFSTPIASYTADSQIPGEFSKGTGSRDRIQIFGQKWTVLVVNKCLSLFLNFQTVPLMRCRHCHYPRGLGENILENLHFLEIYLLIFFAVLFFPIDSLCKLFIPLGPKDHLRTAGKQFEFVCGLRMWLACS